MPYYFYILECTEDRLYVGSCEELESRFIAHSRGLGAEFTKRYKPICIAFSETFPTRTTAMIREAQVKK